MGGLVGSTEQNTRTALRIVDAMQPCVCFVDEIEKALSGVSSSGQTDSGVSSRMFGSMLSWLSDHESDVFFIATSNDISKLPPEFARSERFDGVWFLDLPGSAEKQKIWEMYLPKFQIARQPLPRDIDWTGAEIRACCRLASLLDVSLTEAARNVVPVGVTAAEQMGKLRSWAAGRCLDASAGGIYTRGAPEPTGPGRRVSRPSSN
jgi:SpoVK/Ycf46/Vps4 family AAA+-type ATPase